MPLPNPGRPSTISAVSRLTLITLARYGLEIVEAVVVVDDAALFVGFDAVLVDNPTERGVIVFDGLVRKLEVESGHRVAFAQKR